MEASIGYKAEQHINDAKDHIEDLAPGALRRGL